jgi:predicted CopG family antitoxin
MVESTHIRVSRRAWKQLNSLKEPGDDFDDVVMRLVNQRIESPGVYLINATGEASALATEDGSGDRQLLKEVLDEYDIETND